LLPELTLLTRLLDREDYNRYRGLLNTANLRNNYRDVWAVYQCLDLLMKSTTSAKLSLDELEAFVYLSYPVMKSSEKETYAAIFLSLRGSHVSPEVLEVLLQVIDRRSRVTDLALKAVEYSNGRGDFEDLRTYVESVFERDSMVVEEPRFVTDDFKTLYQTQVATPGLRWRLGSLNKRLGSLRRGDSGFVFGRPEIGKTTWLASEASYMATQANAPCVWFNNEEQGAKVMLRCYEAALGQPLHQLVQNLEQTKTKFLELTGGRIRIFDAASIHRSEVEKVCKELQPALIVFDQLDKITGFDDDRDDLRLGSIYQWQRTLAKTYAPSIGVSQADGTAEGVKWLNMGHVSGAKTSKQAEADWILGIGVDQREGYQNIRTFSLCKNKLVGDEDTDPRLRHDRWECRINAEVARYEDFN